MRLLYVHLFLDICFSIGANGQSTASKWNETRGDVYAGINASTSRYCGDLSERYQLAHLQLGSGIEGHIRYRFEEQWCFISDIGLYHIRGDQHYTKNAANQLSFSATNFSANLGVQWDFRSVDGNDQNILYAIATLGVTSVNPTTTLNGSIYSLPAFRTEGVSYASWAIQAGYGLGFPFTLSPSAQLRLQGKYTHVFSDRLDDVSTNYVDKTASTDLEKQLADKRVGNQLTPNAIGAARGNPTKNDGYFLLTLQLIYKFRRQKS
ncbi:outer membrane beta-barrel protein [Fibrella forsythiae]|uniref:Outer membrane beta-barrel protein n=1 Tax=Fibrella forsythiae TaxID=2817061 RepID=A0ABS3JP58_9BACT|nr:outer membrane beta-barrel protein [Fibrella forsythiae]MBO0951777.1 outer membrane beta-barrel protein [Fibrella forsythiae]